MTDETRTYRADNFANALTQLATSKDKSSFGVFLERPELDAALSTLDRHQLLLEQSGKLIALAIDANPTATKAMTSQTRLSASPPLTVEPPST